MPEIVKRQLQKLVGICDNLIANLLHRLRN